jgi:hypothetical protein
VSSPGLQFAGWDDYWTGILFLKYPVLTRYSSVGGGSVKKNQQRDSSCKVELLIVCSKGGRYNPQAAAIRPTEYSVKEWKAI